MSGSITPQRSTDWAWRAAFATAVMVLGACGGGGGGGDASPSPAPAPAPTPTPAPAPTPTPSPAPSPTPAAVFDIGSALAKVYLAGFPTRTVTGTPDNVLLASQDWTMSVQADEVFEGTSRKVILKNLVTTVTNATSGSKATATQSYKVYFSSAPFQIHGSAVTTAGAGVTVTSQRAALPASATIGQTGDFYSSASWSGAANTTTVMATSVVTWSVEADGISATTAYACLNETTTLVATPSEKNESSECYRIDQSGNLLGVLSRVTVSDATGKKVIISLK